MTILTISTSVDYSATTLSGIDTIQLSGILTATFAASQFDNVQISNAVTIVGNDWGVGCNIMVNGSQIDARNWTFVNWTNHDGILLGGTGSNDVIQGSSQNDQIVGGLGNDALHGNGGDDEIFGDYGNDGLFGGDGNDTLDGGPGKDTLDGGNGDDMLTARGADAGSLINGGAGNDTLTSSGAAIALDGGDGDDVIISDGGDTLIGGAGNDVLVAYGRGDRIDGGSGIDVFHIGGAGQPENLHIDISSGGGGADIGNGTTLANIDVLYIKDLTGNNFVRGGGYADTVETGAGNDTLAGGAGNDALYAGGGRNIIVAGAGDDQITTDASGHDKIYGGAGIDTLVFDSNSDPISVNIDITAGGNDLDIGNGTRLSGIERIVFEGDNGNDTVTGGALDDIIRGGSGNDHFSGGDGNDELHGGGGNDVLSGGAGNDTIETLMSGSQLIDGGEGLDLLHLESWAPVRLIIDISDGGGGRDIGNGTQLSNVEVIDFEYFAYYSNIGFIITGGDRADTMYGGFGNDVFHGGAGNDQLESSGGKDRLFGGAGDDYLYISGLYSAGGEAIAYGGTGSDVLSGGRGRVELNGGGGNDLLVTEAGATTMNGGSGADVFRFDGIASLADGYHATIGDFSQGADMIDLRTFAGLTLIGSAAFSNTAGELRFEQSGGHTFVYGDVDGDGTADFEIEFVGNINFQVSDFVL